MKTENKIRNIFPERSENPFRVPEGYFENFQERLQGKMNELDKFQPHKEEPRKIFLRPFLALAASISGLALIIYIVLQSIIGSNLNETAYYDLTILDEAGFTTDESLIEETYSLEESSYSEWEEVAMNYLASNEVNLQILLESN